MRPTDLDRGAPEREEETQCVPSSLSVFSPACVHQFFSSLLFRLDPGASECLANVPKATQIEIYNDISVQVNPTSKSRYIPFCQDAYYLFSVHLSPHPTTLTKSDNKELGDGFYSYNVQESYQFHWYSYYGEQYGSSLKNKKIRLRNPIPGHISGENGHRKDTWTPMFIVALFTIPQDMEAT